jgi:hypothetical protein
LSSDGPCNVLIFSSTDTVSVANSNNGFYLGANIVDYHTVTPGQALSVVKTPTDGSITSVNGTLWVVCRYPPRKPNKTRGSGGR